MEYIIIIISAVFVNNILLSQFLGICPFLGVSNKVSTAVGMSGAVCFVMALSTLVTYLLQYYVLNPLNIGFMQTIVFILVIAALVQMVEIILKKISPSLYQALGIYLPLITTNCAVLGVAILVVTKEFAFASCFGIINNPDDKRYNDRAMQILFALNNDVYLRNLLQYGVEGTNYTVVDNDVKRVTYIDTTGLTGEALENALNNNENVYNMNLFYTGDVFNAYFCSELGWVKSVYDNGLMQNKDSVVQQ